MQMQQHHAHAEAREIRQVTEDVLDYCRQPSFGKGSLYAVQLKKSWARARYRVR